VKPSSNGMVVASTVAAVLLVTARAAACSATATPPSAQNQSPPNFTFEMDVAMRMRHFPWLGYHMRGIGRYEPGQSYVVHFTSLPWFAPRKQHDADLSMLDPALWPTRFTYQNVGEENGNTMFDLRSIEDPTLTSATVGLGPSWCARQVELTYNDGTHITMNVKFGDVNGFRLPASLTADVDVPHMSLSANADFTNYSFASNAADPSPAPLTSPSARLPLP
jgi:hypothetical protein